jgi:hypothetical protein
MLENLTRDLLAENIHTIFCVKAGTPDALELELIEVTPLTVTPLQEMFAILFRGPLDCPLPQGMYAMQHSRLGTFDLFIVPVRPEADGARYEAVFNRLVK